MKEVMGTARNIAYALQSDGTLAPTVEAILIVSEPQFRADGVGEMIRQREVETIRFTTTAAGLRRLAITFNEWADEADASAPTAKKPRAKKAD